MKAIQHHIYGLKATFETLSKGKLLAFFIPGLVMGGWYLYSSTYTSAIHETADTTEDVWIIGSIVSGILHWVADFAQAILLIAFQFIVLTVLSPFNTILSEKFETELTGTQFKTGFLRILSDLLRMILVVFIALFMEFFFIIFWWALTLIISPLDILSPIVYFLMSAFFFGFAFFDYSLERHNIGTIRSLGFAFTKMPYMILTGAVFQLLFMIPFAGIILAPVVTTMVSTAVYVKLHEKPVIPPAAPNPVRPTSASRQGESETL
jgi:CysZ protein